MTERRPEVEALRERTLVICPDNDAESHIILELAQHAGMATLRSQQRHGASLEREPDILHRAQDAKKPDVWIVEMPGPEMEEQLLRHDLAVRVIDHHVHAQLDRAKDPATGRMLASSLEQFLEAAHVTDEELASWGYDPKTIRGLGIMDALFVQGLRDAGYSQEEINRVMDLNDACARQINPVFEEIRREAMKDWQRRKTVGAYTLVQSGYARDVRGAISHLTIREGMDTEPLIVSSSNERLIFVQNVEPAVVQHLMESVKGKTFTFGTSRCWGVDNTNQDIRASLADVLKALETAPPPK